MKKTTKMELRTLKKKKRKQFGIASDFLIN